jgi:hypothetical protein
MEQPCDDGPLVLVDPDVIFWRAVEGWSFGDALMAGRLMPLMHQGTERFMAVPRLHPSLFWVRSVHKLRAEVQQLEHRTVGWDGIAQRTAHIGGGGVFWDTLAGLYNAMPHLCHPFEDERLDCYDHLFLGSHLVLGAAVNAPVLDALKHGHQLAASGRVTGLKGLWKRQQAAFESLGTPEMASATANDTTSALPRMVALAAEAQSWQGLNYPSHDLQGACVSIAQRIHRGDKGQLRGQEAEA